jgi:hypothetical protein
MFQKKALEHVNGGTLVKNERTYWVDGEIGRIEFCTYQVREQGKTVYNTVGDVFAVLKCWEWYKTTGFKEISLMYGVTEQSYKKTEQLINRVRHQPGATPSTTLRESAEREGTKVLDYVAHTTTAILKHEGFSETGRPLQESAAYQHDAVVVSAETVTQAIDACELSADARAEVEQNPVIYEQAAESVAICLDDVVVKKQKEERTRSGAAHHDETPSEGHDARTYVHNTVAHIQQQDHAYTVNGRSMLAVLRIILGFLLNNDLLQYRLQFFVDGQKTLQAAIVRAFSWCTNVGIILDWYHLNDKCMRQLSLAMKGRVKRNTVLEALTPLLWYGRVDSAIAALKSVSEDDMKNPDAIRVLIGYIERHRPYLPCYEVRKRLGLRNSSQLGEKMNDLLVSGRQKHHGMSWSPGGSSALAALEAIKRNDEYQRWFEYGELELKWAA